MSSEVVLRANDLGKCFEMYSKPVDRLLQAFAREGRKRYREFWALRDVSFEVRRGESMGVVGRNGSGKSTLLQLLAGTMFPTTGEVWSQGRIAALLELGAGFNPEFTGRENVFLNGAILGLTRSEIEDRFDAIAAFADIGSFLDEPVKTYSSGMFVRLAFSVQIQMRPDILIVDEALSVGDMFFQAKCLGVLRKLLDDGMTLFFVSHSLEMIRSICTHALALERGRLVASGTADEVADAYVSRAWSASDPSGHGAPVQGADYRSELQPTFERRITERLGSGDALFVECCLFENGLEVDTVFSGSRVVLVAWLRGMVDIAGPSEVGIVVSTIFGTDLFAVNSHDASVPCGPVRAGRTVKVEVEFSADLAPGVYSVSLGLKSPVQGPYVDKVYTAAVFRVEQSPSRPLYTLVRLPGRLRISGAG